MMMAGLCVPGMLGRPACRAIRLHCVDTFLLAWAAVRCSLGRSGVLLPAWCPVQLGAALYLARCLLRARVGDAGNDQAACTPGSKFELSSIGMRRSAARQRTEPRLGGKLVASMAARVLMSTVRDPLPCPARVVVPCTTQCSPTGNACRSEAGTCVCATRAERGRPA